jgi:predicted CoA-binding protein
VGVNPKYGEVAGVACFPDLASTEPKPDVVVTIVPPVVTEDVMRVCHELGIERVWMQPGSESEVAIRFCEDNGVAVVHHKCIVVDGLGQSF